MAVQVAYILDHRVPAAQADRRHGRHHRRMAFWNDYLLPSLVLGRRELYTIPIATQIFYGTYSNDIGLIMAALLLAMLPILILYLFLQRYIVEGVTSGAVKG